MCLDYGMSTLRDIFNTSDLAGQPSLILRHDFVSGNNPSDRATMRSWVIENTVRGQHLHEFPLTSQCVTIKAGSHAQHESEEKTLHIIHVSLGISAEEFVSLALTVGNKFGVFLAFQKDISIQLFILFAASRGLVLSSSVMGERLCRFVQKKYSIRAATVHDLESLLTLESECWPQCLQASAATLNTRIQNFPSGQLGIVSQGHVVGVVYSQRIQTYKDLRNHNFRTVETLLDPNGTTLQLLALNVLPSVQNQSLGDELLSFVLEMAKVTDGIAMVVGVTRCKAYSKHSHIPYETYIHSKDRTCISLDPVLNFHLSHGAVVVEAIGNYRSEDTENQGYGVLVKYDLKKLNFPASTKAEYISSHKDEVSEILTQAIQSLIPEYIPSLQMSSFLDIGLDSVDLLSLSHSLSTRLGIVLPTSVFFKFPSPNSLQCHLTLLASHQTTQNKVSTQEGNETNKTIKKHDDRIAIIGMACRAPGGVKSISEYWEFLTEGRNGITSSLNERTNLGNPDRTPGGFLQDVSLFDPTFFHISPREAVQMDPQQRLLLETHWEAAESAGVLPESLVGTSTGIFVGISSHDYEMLGIKHKCKAEDSFLATGSSNAVAAGRIAYSLGLCGPAMVIDTACSSSLVSLHVGVKSLLSHDCDLAFVSGVNLILSDETTERYRRAGMLSPSHTCFAFDSRADGYVRSEGVGVLFLKRLTDAERDGNNILGVILGSAITQDGRSNGLTAPNLFAQETVYRKALKQANCHPHEVEYVEAHGTGTTLGDFVEAESLANVYGKGRQSDFYIGSVKTQMGHAEAAAGMMGIIKLCLALKHKFIPPNINYHLPNPHVTTLEGLRVLSEGVQWGGSTNYSKRGAVSSFGFSGTNAHVILEEPPLYVPTVDDKGQLHIVTASAASMKSLKLLIKSYLFFLSKTEACLSNVAFTTTTGRTNFKHRISVTGTTMSEIVTKFQTIKLLPPSVEQKWALGFCGNSKITLSHPLFLKEKERCMNIVFQTHLLNICPTKIEAFISEYAFGRVLLEFCGLPSFAFGVGVGRLVLASLAGVIDLQHAIGLLSSDNSTIRSALKLYATKFSIVCTTTGSILEKLDNNYLLFDSDNNFDQPNILSLFARLNCDLVFLNGQQMTLDATLDANLDDRIVTSMFSYLYNNGIISTLRPFYSHQVGRSCIVSDLPTYVFDKTHYWITISETESELPAAEIKKFHSQAEWTCIIEKVEKMSAREAQLSIVKLLQEMILTLVGLEAEQYEVTAGFVSLGLDSMLLGELRQMIESWLGNSLNISATSLFDYPSIHNLSEYLQKLIFSTSSSVKNPQIPPIPKSISLNSCPGELNHTNVNDVKGVGVVGLACRFGTATTPEEFWEVLSKGETCVRQIPKSRFDVDKYYIPGTREPGRMYVQQGSFLSSIDLFDGSLFGICPKEIEVMDPQQRLLLEVVWEALERSGIPPPSIAGTKTGVFIGQTWNDYGSALAQAQVEQDLSSAYICSGNSYATTSGRVAYTFGTLGPALTVDTACSSSLMAVHLAISSLERGEVDLAIAGGVNLLISHLSWINLCQAGMLCMDGASYTFDCRASGYARGEGLGIVILKRLSDAINDKDKVLVKLNSAANQDGRTSGFTVPNGKAQAELIRKALTLAKLEPSDVDLIEAHGTSTSLGDPIEVGSLENVFKSRSSPLFLTSTKANFNHTEAAAGVCGLIKCILAIQHKYIPPQANFHTLNPNMTPSFHETFQIPLSLTPWPRSRGNVASPKRAGVNSFGFSGTNVHVLVEEVTNSCQESKLLPRPFHILTVSAKSEKSLQLLLSSYKQQLECLPDSKFANFLHTSNTGRGHFKHRIAVVGGSRHELLRSLELTSPGEISKPSTFIFSLDMSVSDCLALARGIYDSVPNFASTLDSTVQLCNKSTLLKELIFKEDTGDKQLASLAQFVIQYAFMKALAHWGLEADYIVGPESSTGQLVGATLSNSISLSSAIDNAQHLTEPEGTIKSTQQIPGQQLNTIEGLRNNISSTTCVGFGRPNERQDVHFCGNVDPWNAILTLLAQLYLKGFTPNFAVINDPFGLSKIQIPTYSFDRRRYWIPALECIGSSAHDIDEKSIPLAIPHNSFYKEQWMQVTKFEREKREFTKCNCILLSTNSALLDTYSDTLCKIGHTSLKVKLTPSSDFTLNHQNGELDIFNLSHFRQLAQSNRTFNAILFLYSECVGAGDPVDSQTQQLASLLHILQNLRFFSDLPFVLVSSGAAPIRTTQSPTFVDSLWATLRSVGREDPTLRISAFDVDSSIPLCDSLNCLFQNIDTLKEIQVAFRHDELYAPRLVEHQISSGFTKFYSNKTYLVTGGLGGIGLQLAKWLVEGGVRNLVLVGRRAPDLTTHAFLKQLQDTTSDLDLRVIQSDVSCKESVYSLLRDVIHTYPELAGIFHAAGAICDATLVHQSIDKFKTALAAKSFGAYFLHSASLDLNMNLDHFVLFSSVSAILGPIAKSNYAAANAFLDSLANVRRLSGHPAQSIRWGAWGEFGMAAADPAFGENNSGIRAFSVKEGLAALGTILASNETTATFCHFDWNRWQLQDCWDRHWLSTMNIFLPPIPKVLNTTLKSEFLTQFDKAKTTSNQLRVTQDHIRTLISKIAGLPLSDVASETKFSDLGLDSLMFMDLQQGIQDSVGAVFTLPTTLVFDYSTLQLLSEYLVVVLEKALRKDLNNASTDPSSSQRPPSEIKQEKHECIAVIGVGCRFPGNVSSADDFWKLLLTGDCTVEEVPKSRYDVDKYYDTDRGVSGKMYCRYGSFISHHDKFDSEFFKINSKEANLMDPQQRILLEVTYEALENASIPVRSLAGSRTGTFVGISNTDYRELLLENKHHPSNEFYHVYTFTGNALSTAAGRVAHTFNLQGPTLSIDTACSSSLVAVHEAVQSLRLGDSDLALASGVNLILSPDPTIQVSKANMLASKSMKTFDAEADGFIRGEGVGVVVLKRLKDAEAAGDNILALIRATGINHDGESATLTSPNARAQELLLNSVLAQGGVTGSDIDFLETHGTSTRIGDPIEVTAIQNSAYGQRSRPLTLGAGKTLLGHLESASGIASFIKVVLSLQRGVIPRNHNFHSLNPLINNDSGLLRFPTKNTSWEKRARQLYLAGVSSFGMSGTNAHIILQQPPSTHSKSISGYKSHLLTLSAKTESALEALKGSFVSFLEKDVSLANLCYTSQVGREHYAHRLALTASSLVEMKDKLSQSKVKSGHSKEAPSIAIVFSTQTRCIPSREIYESQEVYRSTIDACQLQISQSLPGFLLNTTLGRQPSRVEADILHFCAQYAMAKELEAFDLNAAQLVGTGVGLLVASCVSGNLSLENALSWLLESDKSDVLLKNEGVGILDGEGVELSNITENTLTKSLHVDKVSSTLIANGCTLAIFVDLSPRICSLSPQDVHFFAIDEELSEWESLLNTLAHLYVQGSKLNFQPIQGGHSISIPTYPFLKRRHWAKSLETKMVKDETEEVLADPVLESIDNVHKIIGLNANPVACILGCSSKKHLADSVSAEDDILAVCLEALEDALIPSDSLKGSNTNICFNVVNSNFLAPSLGLAQKLRLRLGLSGTSVDLESNDMSIMTNAIATIETDPFASFIVGSVIMEEDVVISANVLILKAFQEAVSSGDRILRVVNAVGPPIMKSLLDEQISCENLSDLCRTIKENIPSCLCMESLSVECWKVPLCNSNIAFQKSSQILTISAPTTSELRNVCRVYEKALLELPLDERLADIAFTSNTARNHLQQRVALVGKTTAEIILKLKSIEITNSRVKDNGKVVFLFTGQGSQYSGMGKSLFFSNTTFRSYLEECDTILRRELKGKSIIELMFDAEMGNLLHRTEYSQPCLFSLEYSLAQMWLHLGVTPDYLIGHSVGEYVAATLAGVMTLEQGLCLISHRARLMQSLPEGFGGMIAVKASADTVTAALLEMKSPSDLQLATINSPTQVVVSGPIVELDSFSALLKCKGLRSTKLNVSHAFHSSLLSPIAKEFRTIAQKTEYSRPKFPIISNLTAEVMEEYTADYWLSHLLSTVNFVGSVVKAGDLGGSLWLEIGPKPLLLTLVKQIRGTALGESRKFISSLNETKENWESVLEAVGLLYEAGLTPLFKNCYPLHSVRRVGLPTLSNCLDNTKYDQTLLTGN